jgi:hypothetical protein
MKSYLSLILVILLGSLLSAQTFTKVGEVPFANSQHGTVVFEDLNGDGAPDAFFAGAEFFDPVATLYLNDGHGNFIEKSGHSILGTYKASVAFIDIDGNQTKDLIISGQNGINNGQGTKIYLNDGAANFTEKPLGVMGTLVGSFVSADFDGNNTPDLIFVGFFLSKLFVNDGAGNFTEKPNPDLELILGYSAAAGDLNGDGFEDVIITGLLNATAALETYVYINDGAGNFSIKTGTQLAALSLGVVRLADIDGNNTQDLLMLGRQVNSSNQLEKTIKLYLNNGTATFIEKTGLPFTTADIGSITFADLTGDNALDLLITGDNAPLGASAFEPVTKLYINDGFGEFTEKTDISLQGVISSSASVADVDGNNTMDLVLTGATDAMVANFVSELYLNDGIGTFTQKPSASLVGVSEGLVAFTDMDGDGEQDILISGLGDSAHTTRVYLNAGNSSFKEMPNMQIESLSNGSMAVADVTGDTYPDVLISGFHPLGIPFPFTKLYENDGSGGMNEILTGAFNGVALGSLKIADVNGDNKADILITGEGITGLVAKLYMNQGNSNFQEKTNTPFEGVKNSSIALADVDGDGNKDILIAGRTDSERITKLYLNDGMGNFTEKTGTPFEAIDNGSVVFADVDGNQTQDLVIAGASSSGRITKLYINDGAGNFTEKTNSNFVGISNGAIAFAKVDDNQSPDLLITGYDGGKRTHRLYLNDGTGSFYTHNELPFDTVMNSAVAFGDVNGDGRNDVLISGVNNSFEKIASLYLNEGGMFTSVEEKIREEAVDFMLYPNPATGGEITIEIPSMGQRGAMVRILDFSGRQVALHQTQGKKVSTIDISALPPGYYIAQVYDGVKHSFRKFMVE